MSEATDKTIVDDAVPSTATDDATGEASGPTILASRYELLGLLGSGGMGTVYRARDRELDEIVALKVLRKEVAQAPGMLERFRREVKLARKVTHVNVARTFDIGEDGGDRFITMELIEGEPLSALSGRERLPVGRVLAIAREVLEGLAASHDAGVVHGDLKPENVLCTSGGRVVITDFGIARALEIGAGEHTATGMLVGTPQYMAPEQVEGTSDLDGRTDLYALGCMLFRLVTGEPAWSGGSYVTVAAARLLREPPDPGALRPELAAEVRAFIVKCMARDRKDRFPDARSASAALSVAMTHANESAKISMPKVTAIMRAAKLDERHVSPPSTRTVAVLPIHNQGAADDAYLAAGLTDDLIDILSAVPQLRVRPRGAVAPFDGPTRDAREAGRALGVEAIIEGSLRRAGEVLRVTLRLVTVADGFQLWAKRFDRPSCEFFAVGDAAAAELAAVLASEKVTPARESPTDAAALDLYLRGRFIFTRSYFDIAEAVALLRAAHERAPGDGRISAAYALALMRHHHISNMPGSVAEQARSLANRALTDDPTVGEAHVALALVHLSQTEVRSAAVSLLRALELAPHNVDALHWLGSLLIECGRFDEAMKCFQAALAEDAEFHLARATVARMHALRSDWESCFAMLDRVGGERGERGDVLLQWMLRARFAVWQRDPETATRYLHELESATIPIPTRERLRAMFSVARDRKMSEQGRELLHAELTNVNAPRRTAFNTQIRIELFAAANLLDDAIVEYTILDDACFIDIGWLDRCPVLAALRDRPEHLALRRATGARVDRILDAVDASTSGLRLRGT